MPSCVSLACILIMYVIGAYSVPIEAVTELYSPYFEIRSVTTEDTKLSFVEPVLERCFIMVRK